MISDPKRKRVDSITAQVMLREAYEATMGFRNYDDPATSPLSLVVDVPAEDVTERTLFTSYAERYRLNNVSKHYGLSLSEFLDLPFEYAEELLDLSLAASGAESRMMQNIAAELEKT